MTNSAGQAVLQLTSTKTGTANGFTVAGLDHATLKTAVAAQDAEIQVGDPANGGYTVTSDSNTFTNLMPGVTLTASEGAATGVTVSVTTDSDAIAAQDAGVRGRANASLAEVNKQGAITPGAKTQPAPRRRLRAPPDEPGMLSAVGNGLAGLRQLQADRRGADPGRHAQVRQAGLPDRLRCRPGRGPDGRQRTRRCGSRRSPPTRRRI